MSRKTIDARHDETQLAMVNTDTFAIEAQVDLGLGSRPVGVAVAPQAVRPQNLTGSVAGRDVTLTWSPGAGGTAPTSDVLEVGLTPGATDLTISAPATSYTGSGVPSGTYYVSVRARNALTQSAPSNEVLLVVR